MSSLEKSSYFRKFTRFENLNEGNFNAIKFFGSLMSLSSLINNTPLVSLFIPIAKRVSSKTGIHIQKLLLPISYFALFGGVLTLIGTSTNLVVSGLSVDFGYSAFHFFEQTPIALPGVVLSSIYVLLSYKKRLPERISFQSNNIQMQNEHFVRFVVHEKSSLIGKTVSQAKLRSLKGV